LKSDFHLGGGFFVDESKPAAASGGAEAHDP
jgi:hypothetical protein